MLSRQNIKLAIAIGLSLVFAILLAINLWNYALVDFFLMVLMITLLKKLEVKIIFLVLSPLAVYLIIYLIIGLVAMLLPSQFVYLITPVIFGLLYAYLFRKMLYEWIEPSLRWVGFGLACLLITAAQVSGLDCLKYISRSTHSPKITSH